MLEAQVKQREHERRAKEDQNAAARDAARVMVDADSREQLQRFRYAELEHQKELEQMRLESNERIAKLQIDAQIQAAMARTVSTEGATQ